MLLINLKLLILRFLGCRLPVHLKVQRALFVYIETAYVLRSMSIEFSLSSIWSTLIDSSIWSTDILLRWQYNICCRISISLRLLYSVCSWFDIALVETADECCRLSALRRGGVGYKKWRWWFWKGGGGGRIVTADRGKNECRIGAPSWLDSLNRDTYPDSLIVSRLTGNIYARPHTARVQSIWVVNGSHLNLSACQNRSASSYQSSIRYEQ